MISMSNTYSEADMYVSYDHYHVFYYVAKYESISQAAKVLLSNQPNVKSGGTAWMPSVFANKQRNAPDPGG